MTPEGHILVNDAIDRETQDSYSFQVSGLLITHSDLSAHVLSNLRRLPFVSNWLGQIGQPEILAKLNLLYNYYIFGQMALLQFDRTGGWYLVYLRPGQSRSGQPAVTNGRRP